MDGRRAPAGPTNRQRLRIEELLIDPETGEITGPGGQERLDPKVLAVLMLLARDPGAVISKDTFHETLWPGVIVTDDALSRCIYLLRQHLARAGGDVRYRKLLETLPKRGYRLNAQVTGVACAAEPRATAPAERTAGLRGRRGTIALILFAVAVTAALLLRPSTPADAPTGLATIGVLPFTDLSAEPGQAYLAQGLAEEILDSLSRLPGARVIARSSSFAAAERERDLEALARRLHASHLVEGSVRAAGQQIRVTARLVDAANATQIWSQTYQGQRSEILELQSDIAAAVALALSIQIPAAAAARRRPPPDPNAEEHYLLGRYFHNRRAPGDARRALAHFERAVALDPNHARAWAWLAGTLNVLLADPGTKRTEPPQQGLASMGAALRRAIALEPDLPVAQARLGQYLALTGDRTGAARALRRALAPPEDPLALTVAAGFAMHEGRLADAIRLQRQALALDPISLATRSNLAAMLIRAGQHDEAYRELQIAEDALPGPAFAAGHQIVATSVAEVLILQRRFPEALAYVGRWPQHDQRDRYLAMIYHALGRHAEAETLVRRQMAVPDERGMLGMAEVLAYLGRTEPAWRRLLETREAFLSDPQFLLQHSAAALWELAASPFLAPLHSDARWTAWVKRVAEVRSRGGTFTGPPAPPRPPDGRGNKPLLDGTAAVRPSRAA